MYRLSFCCIAQLSKFLKALGFFLKINFPRSILYDSISLKLSGQDQNDVVDIKNNDEINNTR